MSEKPTERGIIYSPMMIRAKLDKIKDITRRTWGLEYINEEPDKFKYCGLSYPIYGNHKFRRGRETYFIKCPYGNVGDRLWTREKWWNFNDPKEWRGSIIYFADRPGLKELDGKKVTWKSSMYMPKWASRFLDKIVSLRPERLHDITEEDAVREGMRSIACHYFTYDLKEHETFESAKDAFMFLWNQLNAKKGYAWDFNPWVWRIEFKAVDL